MTLTLPPRSSDLLFVSFSNATPALRLEGFFHKLLVVDLATQVSIKLRHHVVNLFLVEEHVGELENGTELWERQVAIAVDVKLAERSPHVLPVAGKLQSERKRDWC